MLACFKDQFLVHDVVLDNNQYTSRNVINVLSIIARYRDLWWDKPGSETSILFTNNYLCNREVYDKSLLWWFTGSQLCAVGAVRRYYEVL